MDILKELQKNIEDINYNGDIGKLQTIIEAKTTLLFPLLICKIIKQEDYFNFRKIMSLRYTKALEKELEQQPNWED